MNASTKTQRCKPLNKIGNKPMKCRYVTTTDYLFYFRWSEFFNLCNMTAVELFIPQCELPKEKNTQYKETDNKMVDLRNDGLAHDNW